MDYESLTYEEHTKKARKNQFLLLVVLLLVVAILGSVFLFAACRYFATDLSLISLQEDAYRVADGFLFPLDEALAEKGTYVASYNLTTGDLHQYPIETYDLSDCGLSGLYTYFRYRPSDAEDAGEGRIRSASIQELPLSRANTEDCFVCADPQGQKFLVDTRTHTFSPLFEGSTAEGVDPYGGCISTFSHNGLYAAGVQGNTLVIYVRENTESFAVQTAHKIDFASYGEIYAFDFASESYLLVTCLDEAGGLTHYLANAPSGEVSACPKAEGANTSVQNLLKTPYGQLYHPLEAGIEESEKEGPTLRYASAALGTVWTHELPEETARARVTALSPRGEYALLALQSASDSSETLLLSKSGGRQVSLASLAAEELGQGEEILAEQVCFLSENVVLVNLSSESGTRSAIIKICF